MEQSAAHDHRPFVRDSVAAQRDSALRDSSLKASNYVLQFLAGEFAFNGAFFALWGDHVFRQDEGTVTPAAVGLLASWIATPLAIHYVTKLMHLKTGDWGFGILGAALGAFIGPSVIDQGTRTNTKIYLGLSLGIILFSQLFYDFTIWNN